MKNIKFILALALIFMTLSCQNEYETPNEYSAVSWYNSLFNEGNALGLNDYLSFADLSQGALSHSWTIQNENGSHFLTGSIRPSNKTYDQFIDQSLANVSEEKIVHVLFTKPGLQTVHLYNTFKDSVSFKGKVIFPSKRVGDVWVIDTTFVVDVYDSIQPALKAYRDLDLKDLIAKHDANETGHALKDSASWPVITIMAGESINCVDETTLGRPTGRTWVCEGGKPSNPSDATTPVYFYKLGRYHIALDSKRSGSNIPSGSKRQYVPVTIEVIKSTLPLTILGQGVELENQTIQLSFGGEIAPLIKQEGFFKVSVTNGTFKQDIAVSKATVNAKDGTIIDLVLAAPIYNTDKITVSWQDGTIRSVDGRDLVPFTNIPVKMYVVNILAQSPGFEDAIGTWKQGKDHVIGNVAEYSTDGPFEGEKCYHLVSYTDTKRASAVNSTLITLTKGKTYNIDFKVKIISGPVGYYEWRLNREGVIDAVANKQGYPYAGSVTGQWIEKSTTFTYADDAKTVGLQLLVYKVSDMYYDNISIYEVEARPL